MITTLFLAMYYDDVGNYTGVYNILAWCIEHSQHGLLPEAIDPRLGYPLPTTSPLTWSAAMYVLTALNYRPQHKPVITTMVLVAVVIILLAIVMFAVYGRPALDKPYGLTIIHEHGRYLKLELQG